MKLEVNQAHILPAQDHRMVGAALKILASGGMVLTRDQMSRAAGTTAYFWDKNAANIVRLVKKMSSDDA